MKELVNIQIKLKAPKGQMNKFGGYRYRSCEDILEAVKPLLEENECYLTLNDEIQLIGTRFYVKATATLTNKDGKTVSASAFAREEESKKGMDASQLTGACSSYARKYALNGLFCIDDTKDADAEDTLQLALQEIESATSLQVLSSIFNNYKALQSDGVFINALSAKKKILKDAQ